MSSQSMIFKMTLCSQPYLPLIGSLKTNVNVRFELALCDIRSDTTDVRRRDNYVRKEELGVTLQG